MNADGPHALCFEAFGVTLRVTFPDPALEPAIGGVLPPGHRPAPCEAAVATVTVDGATDAALRALDSELRLLVATHAPGLVFIHAGVVEWAGGAIVLPGRTRAGKTELVAALLRAGASYGSDELAVLDPSGLAHPYPRALSLRARGTLASRPVPPAALGAALMPEAVPVALIAVARYEQGAHWEPRRLSPAQGAVALLAHAGQVRGEPARVLDTVERAARNALVLEGTRGEADAVAAALLSALGR